MSKLYDISWVRVVLACKKDNPGLDAKLTEAHLPS